MIRTWKIIGNILKEVQLDDQSSLDAIARQLPDGYYSTFRTHDGCTRVLGLSAHLQRLPDVDASLLRRQLLSALKPYRPGEARVRVMMTQQRQVYISIEPLKLLPRKLYEKGVHVVTTDIQRDSPRIKSTAFISASDSERRHIAKTGFHEALLVKNGRILEGMTSNFFYILGNRAQREELYTAQHDVLLGVTRRNVIRVARGRGLEMRYKPLRLDQLSAVREAFITSSSRGIVPVVQIDNVKVGRGKVGQTTKLLMKAYEWYVLKHAEKI